MKHLNLKLTLAFCAMTMLATVPVVAQADEDRPVIKVPRGGGRATFTQNCTTCHMPDGRGGQNEGGYGADLRVTTLTEDELVDVITNGRMPKGMPAWKGMIDDEKIRQLATFIKEDLKLKK